MFEWGGVVEELLTEESVGKGILFSVVFVQAVIQLRIESVSIIDTNFSFIKYHISFWFIICCNDYSTHKSR